MIYIYIAIGAFLIMLMGYILMLQYQKKIYRKVTEYTMKILNQYGVRHEHRHVLIDLNHETYQVLLYFVPTHAELTINSKIMWEIKESNKINLVNQSHFLSSPYPKIVIVFPTTVRMKRYINENEMEFITYNKKFHNMYVVRPHELETLLKELNHA
ncbi:MAG TPA: hypothetical protein PLP48_08505 [Acholeplasmataceae bacterium]|nr:hypothetical protein [Acholeplasmataceae bacterium]